MNFRLYQTCFFILVSCVVTYIEGNEVPDVNVSQSNSWGDAPDVTQFHFNYTNVVTIDEKNKNILEAALSMDMEELYSYALCHVATGNEMMYYLENDLLQNEYYGKEIGTEIRGFCSTKPSFGITKSTLSVTAGRGNSLYFAELQAETFVTTNWKTTLIEGDITAPKLDKYGKGQMAFDGFLEFSVKQFGVRVLASYLIKLERQENGEPAIKRCLEDLMIEGVDPKFEMVNCISDEMEVGTRNENEEIIDICSKPPENLNHVCQEVTDELCVRLYEDIVYHMFEESVVELYNHVQENLPLCNDIQL